MIWKSGSLYYIRVLPGASEGKTMSYRSKLPASWNDSPAPRKVEIDLSSPGLAVFELERLLFTGKAIISHADEVWPRLYIGDQ